MSEVIVEVLDLAQGAALFDARARAALGISGTEFLAVYDTGKAWDIYDHEAVSGLVMLIPFARYSEGELS